MTTTQRPRPSRQAPPSPDPASRGLIIVAVAVVLGVILLIKGGGVGFERDAGDVEIGTGSGEEQPSTTDSTTTSEAPPATIPPADLAIAALNAAGIDGYAGQTQKFLGVAGYTSVTPITAKVPVEETVIYFGEGRDADALMLAQRLELEGDRLQPMPEDPTSLARNAEEFPEGTQIAIVLGPDVANTVQGASGD